MKKGFLHTTLFLLLVILFSGCSTSKNTMLSRAYHNTTSRFNVHFNASESLKSGQQKIENGIEDDYTFLLPIFKDSDPSSARLVQSDMENVILKASKLIELHSITQKPKRRRNRSIRYIEFASKEEYNKWIDDSYLLMGKAYFYQDNFISAIDNLTYVIRKFPEGDCRYEAALWLIRSYTEMERFLEAADVINELQDDPAFPKNFDNDLAVITADFYLQQNEYTEAIKFLDIAIKNIFWKKQKARLTYILAQLYEETGNNYMASQTFNDVTKLNAPYNMSFNAKINAAVGLSNEEDSEQIKKELRKMLNDKKNTEFKDQIYYALGNINYMEGNKSQAIDNYRKSVSNSISNNFQLAKSAITLADIYFEDLQYRESQAYYDSAIIVIENDYPNYENISSRYINLTQLVDNIITVEREDSLQKIALMDPADRNMLIDQWIQEEQERQAELEALASQGQGGSSFYRSNEYRFGLGSSQSGGGWYFYNPQTVSYGKVQFEQLWGRRTLEDNWRRSNKTALTTEEYEQFEELTDSSQIVVRIEDPLTREYYTQDLPLTDSLMEISHEKIQNALYNAGKIFKTEYNNYERAIEAFEDLINRYPENDFALTAYFELYDLYQLTGNISKSNTYKNIIISDFPESNYAKYLINPNFFIDLEIQKDSINSLYQFTYNRYKEGKYPEVITLTEQLKELDPDSSMIPKIDFFNTIAKGTQSTMPVFESTLKEYISKYPEEETTPLAQNILVLLQDSSLADYQKLVESGYLNDQIQNRELLLPTVNVNDEFNGKFSYDEDLLHYFIISYPRNSDVDVNRLKFDIANYNIDHYTKLDFDVETENLDANNSLLVVKSLNNKAQSLIYFRSIIRQPEVFQSLTGVDYINIVASSSNYRAILDDNSLTDYLQFFISNYSRFIGGQFEDEELLDESPEELMAKAEAEEEELQERGTYVMVTNVANSNLYNTNIDTTQNFVLAVKDDESYLSPVLSKFSDNNSDNFRTWNLALQIRRAGDYYLMVVNGLPGYSEGMSYFRSVITNRDLFENLVNISYRNFLITNKNLSVLTESGELDQYMDFFRNYYIQAENISQEEIQSQSITEQTSQLSIEERQDNYSGSYSFNNNDTYYFTFVIPVEGFNKDAFIQGIELFNSESYSDLNLMVESIGLDDFREIIRVSIFNEINQAQEYASNITSTRSLFEPLGELTYRNFLISENNFGIFLEEKNITEYMEFYRLFFLEE